MLSSQITDELHLVAQPVGFTSQVTYESLPAAHILLTPPPDHSSSEKQLLPGR